MNMSVENIIFVWFEKVEAALKQAKKQTNFVIKGKVWFPP